MQEKLRSESKRLSADGKWNFATDMLAMSVLECLRNDDFSVIPLGYTDVAYYFQKGLT